MRRIAALAIAVLAASTAQAQSRSMQTIWMIQPGAGLEGERDLAAGDFVVKQRLLPMGLSELESDVVVKGVTLTAGTQLVEVQSPGAKVYCPATVAKQKLIGMAQLCLVDGDRDGRFEGWFKTQSQTKGLLTIGGSRPKTPTAIAPVAYREIEPVKMKDEYFVAIERRNYFNIYSRESFMIVFGRDGEVDRLTSPISFTSSEMPKDLTVLGARFTAISEADGKMRVKILSGMPVQPFGVIKTTTYSFH